MGWFFKKKNKFNKLTYEEVSNAKRELEEKEEKIEKGILEKQAQIDEAMKLGKDEKNRHMRMILAKKIQFLREEIEQDYKRTLFLMYNMKLMNKLKLAIEDNEFLNDVDGVSLNSLLQDQKGLAKFLNKVLNRKIKEEDILTSADDIFEEVKDSYEESEKIYGIDDDVDKILASFELEDTIETTIPKDKKLKGEKFDV